MYFQKYQETKITLHDSIDESVHSGSLNIEHGTCILYYTYIFVCFSYCKLICRLIIFFILIFFLYICNNICIKLLYI